METVLILVLVFLGDILLPFVIFVFLKSLLSNHAKVVAKVDERIRHVGRISITDMDSWIWLAHKSFMSRTFGLPGRIFLLLGFLMVFAASFMETVKLVSEL